MNIHTKCELIVEDKLVMSWYRYEMCISISGGVSIKWICYQRGNPVWFSLTLF